MKSKSIFIVLLLSMLLNVFHDFTISHQIDTKCSTEVEPSEKSKKCNQVDELHHFFHFSAIVICLRDELSLIIQSVPLFVTIHPPFLILQTSFKPPKI